VNAHVPNGVAGLQRPLTAADYDVAFAVVRAVESEGYVEGFMERVRHRRTARAINENGMAGDPERERAVDGMDAYYASLPQNRRAADAPGQNATPGAPGSQTPTQQNTSLAQRGGATRRSTANAAPGAMESQTATQQNTSLAQRGRAAQAPVQNGISGATESQTAANQNTSRARTAAGTSADQGSSASNAQLQLSNTMRPPPTRSAPSANA
jgi:hypothetical protein